ncbi:hypothetical protein [Glaciihabitans sp. dw_435]|uniref:hypothetical protein n=1 Tax=Glaciihabitans sp. dw_435 TaxID=2720081 RepID=UPI001BD54230|nr:hypothetical protein [Glaciihabitans sp. dw_435]
MDRGLDPRTSLEDADQRLDANLFVIDVRSARLRRISWISRVIAISAVSVGLVVVLRQSAADVFDFRPLLPIYIVSAVASVASSLAQARLLRNRGPAASPAGYYVAAGASVLLAVVLAVSWIVLLTTRQ